MEAITQPRKYYRVSHIEMGKESTVALTDVQMDIFNFQSLVTCSGGYGIWVSSTSFQKSNISWLQQPPREKILDINKNLDF